MSCQALPKAVHSSKIILHGHESPRNLAISTHPQSLRQHAHTVGLPSRPRDMCLATRVQSPPRVPGTSLPVAAGCLRPKVSCVCFPLLDRMVSPLLRTSTLCTTDGRTESNRLASQRAWSIPNRPRAMARLRRVRIPRRQRIDVIPGSLPSAKFWVTPLLSLSTIGLPVNEFRRDTSSNVGGRDLI